MFFFQKKLPTNKRGFRWFEKHIIYKTSFYNFIMIFYLILKLIFIFSVELLTAFMGYFCKNVYLRTKKTRVFFGLVARPWNNRQEIFCCLLGATKVRVPIFWLIVTDRAEILRDGLEEGRDPSFWIKFYKISLSTFITWASKPTPKFSARSETIAKKSVLKLS